MDRVIDCIHSYMHLHKLIRAFFAVPVESVWVCAKVKCDVIVGFIALVFAF